MHFFTGVLSPPQRWRPRRYVSEHRALTRCDPALSSHGGDGMAGAKSKLRDALRVPQVAWPTVGLFVGALGLWAFAIWCAATGSLSLVGACLLSTLAFHALFTVMHDASHHAISRHRWVNEVLGRLCGSAFLRAFVGFRFIHQQHHKHTNDPERDPDTWSGQGPAWLLPLRWATQDLVYSRFYRARWASRPISERIELVVLSALEYGALITLVYLGFGLEVLALWVLPAKLTLTLLAFTFDYLPHRPHEVSASEDRYRTTSVRLGLLGALVTFNQSLHGVHHLYPSAPFYRYGRIWRVKGRELIARGMPVRGADLGGATDALDGAQLAPASLS